MRFRDLQRLANWRNAGLLQDVEAHLNARYSQLHQQWIALFAAILTLLFASLVAMVQAILRLIGSPLLQITSLSLLLAVIPVVILGVWVVVMWLQMGRVTRESQRSIVVCNLL